MMERALLDSRRLRLLRIIHRIRQSPANADVEFHRVVHGDDAQRRPQHGNVGESRSIRQRGVEIISVSRKLPPAGIDEPATQSATGSRLIV